MGGVALGQIDIADSVIHLVEVVLILVAGCHALQTTDHLLGLTGCHHLGHSNAGVEFYLVGRILGHHLLIGFVGFLFMTKFRLQLAEQVVLAGFLAFAHLVLDDLAQIRNSLRVVARVDVVVGHGVIPLLLCAPVDAVAAHVANDVLGIVYPVLLDVALCQPSAGTAVDGGLRLVEAAHIIERRGGLVEGTLVELRASHEQPRFPKEGIILLPRQPLQVTLGLAALLVPFWFVLDAVQLNSLLTFLDSLLEVALAQLLRLLVADSIKGNQLRKVILVAVFLLQRAVDIGQRTIIVSIITGIERVPPSALRSVLLRRTTCHQSCQDQQQEHPYVVRPFNCFLLFRWGFLT